MSLLWCPPPCGGIAFQIQFGKLHVSQPHFEASVSMRLTLPKVGTWSPSGLLQLQSSIAEVKTPCLEVFLILLKRPWSLDVENGLAWAIWTSATQVMVERTAESQTTNLTPDHKKSGINPIPMCADAMRHTVGKLLKRATNGSKSHLDASAVEQRREYYMGEGGGFPRVLAVVNQVSQCCPWFVPTPRVFPKVI
jgi:hypothetical protein